MLGYSRGSEIALLLAQHYPTLIHGVVVYAPSSLVNDGFPGGGTAWTWHDQPVPQTEIPVDAIDRPVLAIAGTDDEVWPSSAFADDIVSNLDNAHNAYPHTSLVYPGAGHLVGSFPYGSWPNMFRAASGVVTYFGRTKAGDEAAREQGWPRVLSLLASLNQPG